MITELFCLTVSHNVVLSRYYPVDFTDQVGLQIFNSKMLGQRFIKLREVVLVIFRFKERAKIAWSMRQS